MEYRNIVVFKSSEDRLTLLEQQLKQLGNSYFFQLPGSDTSLANQDAVIATLQISPDIIFIDIDIGYGYQDLIQCLRAELDNIQPIIIGVVDSQPQADMTSLLTRLPIDSFIFSDWSTERILIKLDRLNVMRKHNEQLRNEVKSTSQTALIAMKAASETGLLIQMIEWLNTAYSVDAVSQCLFRLCNSLDLKASCMIVSNDRPEFFPEGGVLNWAKKILLEARERDIRVLSKNRIIVFRLDFLVLIVTNAPWEDEEKYGRYRDIVLQAAALAEAKSRTIAVNTLISEQHQQVSSIMALIENATIETQKYARDIMKGLSEDLSMAAVTLDLNEEQENRLLALSNNAHDSIDLLYAGSHALEEHFHNLIASITRVKELTNNRTITTAQPETFDENEVTLF